jgi:hypothetical protein
LHPAYVAGGIVIVSVVLVVSVVLQLCPPVTVAEIFVFANPRMSKPVDQPTSTPIEVVSCWVSPAVNASVSGSVVVLITCAEAREKAPVW